MNKAELLQKAKPILFSTPMVAAILAGRKSMTRRVITPQPPTKTTFKGIVKESENKRLVECGVFVYTDGTAEYIKPRYKVGDVLYVRETFYQYGEWHIKVFTDKSSKQKEKYVFISCGIHKPIYYCDTLPTDIQVKRGYKSGRGYYKRPSIHMPKAAARLFLRLTDVRAERLQEISAMDIYKEGVMHEAVDSDKIKEDNVQSYREFTFAPLWNCLNEKRGYGWETNPYIFAYSFERIVPETGVDG